MNDFEENTWTSEQRDLDGRITLDVEAIAGSRFVYEATGAPIEAWAATAAEQVKSVREKIALLEHTGRRQHWERELQNLGIPKSDAETAVIDEFEAAGDAAEAAIDAAADTVSDAAAERAEERAADRAEAAEQAERATRRKPRGGT